MTGQLLESVSWPQIDWTINFYLLGRASFSSASCYRFVLDLELGFTTSRVYFFMKYSFYFHYFTLTSNFPKLYTTNGNLYTLEDNLLCVCNTNSFWYYRETQTNNNIRRRRRVLFVRWIQNIPKTFMMMRVYRKQRLDLSLVIRVLLVYIFYVPFSPRVKKAVFSTYQSASALYFWTFTCYMSKLPTFSVTFYLHSSRIYLYI